jgi:hypothetical protein
MTRSMLCTPLLCTVIACANDNSVDLTGGDTSKQDVLNQIAAIIVTGGGNGAFTDPNVAFPLRAQAVDSHGSMLNDAHIRLHWRVLDDTVAFLFPAASSVGASCPARVTAVAELETASAEPVGVCIAKVGRTSLEISAVGTKQTKIYTLGAPAGTPTAVTVRSHIQ